jgi:hypothetical protein
MNMISKFAATLLVILLPVFLLSQTNLSPAGPQPGRGGLSQADPATQARVAESYGKLPLSFEANHGQTDARVKFLSRGSGYSLFLTGDEAVLALSGKKADASKTKVAGAARTCTPAPSQTKRAACCG